MKQGIKILTYLMLLFLLTAEDCGNSLPSPSPAEVRLNKFQRIEDEFTSDWLSDGQLIAFEERAEQKLFELFDLIAISSDTSLDTLFRQEARKSINDSFITNANVDGFLNAHTGISIKSVAISSSFQFNSNSKYAGKIAYKYEFRGEIIIREMPMVLEKSTKRFGDSSLEVWEIFFSTD